MFVTGLGNIPMITSGALDSNSLMRQLSSPRIRGAYDSRSIFDMPTGISGMGMGMPSGMGGYIGAAGLGLAAGAMLSQSGGLSGLGSSLGLGGQQQQQPQYAGQQNYIPQQNGGQLPDRSGGMNQQVQQNSYMNQPPYNQVNQQGVNGQPAYMNQPPYNQVNQQGVNGQPAYMNQPPYNQVNQQGTNGQPAYMNQPPYNQMNQTGIQTQSGYSSGNIQGAYSSMPQNSGYVQNAPSATQQQGGLAGLGGSFNPDSLFNLGAPQPVYNRTAPMPQSNAPSNFNPNAGINNAQPAKSSPLPQSTAPTSFNPNAGINNAQPAQPAPLPQSTAPTSFNPNAGINNAQPAKSAPLPQSTAPTSFNPNAGINNAQPVKSAPLPQSTAPTSFNPNAGINNAQPAKSAPLPQSTAPTSFNPNAGINNTQPAQPAPETSKPKIKRRRAPASGKIIVRGQKTALEAPGQTAPGKIKICLGWETDNDCCELDASAFMLGAGDKVPSDDWFIFYGQPESPDHSVSYKVFDEEPSNCDDAAVTIDLKRIDPRVEKITVAVTIYQAFEKKLNFGMVSMVYARIVDCASGRELMRFELTDRNRAVTALVACELYRYNGSWKFNAVGSGVNRDLAGFCGMYGVDFE